MGRSHVLSGWCAGAVAAHGIGLPPAGVVAFGVTAAGASALNDLDHPSSSATRVLGPVSWALSRAVRGYARLVYVTTRGPGDPRSRSAHRGATHSLPLLAVPILVLLGLPELAWGAVAGVAWIAGWPADTGRVWAGPVAVACVVGFCLVLVADRLGGRYLAVAGLAVVLYSGGTATINEPGQVTALAPWLAAAVGVGTVTHVLGDWVTESGLYALAPLYRRDRGTAREKRWVRIALPKSVAFRTGGWFERRVVFWLLLVPWAVLAVPGVWPVALAGVAR
ncbi:MAG: metal-dependent hydrolase [Acidimicrobiales bacterium]